MEYFSLLYLIMEKHGEIKKDTQLLFPTSAKKTKRGKECAAFGCSDPFYNSGTAIGLFFFVFRFTSLLSEISWWFILIKRHNNKDVFYVSLALFYVTTILWK